ncbi:MAG: diguanylate cyclase [Deltaproteobacteria bacterium]|nr:diguanylate cyclase [Deltaproteobacteria bacterium]
MEDNILIVDDEENVISALRRVFMEAPVTIFSATSVDEGMEVLKRQDIKVVISDERMPGTTGSEFLSMIRRDFPHIVRIMLTGYASIDAAMKAINEGEIYRFFMKPWNDNELKVNVRTAIDKFNLEEELRQKKELISHMAYHDTLTGLPNRQLLNDRVAQAIEYSRRHDLMLSVCFLDLDGFKAVNDTFGHDIGDLLLKQVSERLKGCVRKSDTVARLGGDEFIIMLQDISEPEDAGITAGKIIKELAKGFVLDGRELSITASIGVALYPVDGEEIETLIKKADAAMYHAKQAGKNNFRLYSSNKEA